jgi:hypothetical protein
MGGLAEADVDIYRFPDIDPAHWAYSSVEGCAGMVPTIVFGFPDGYYRPTVEVRRDAMAVYIRRSMDIDLTSPATATFPDVPSTHWAYADIESLANAGVVGGYPSGYYRPDYVVRRDQMAVFVANGKGWTLTTPASAPFTDVAVDHWAVDEIYTCVVNNVVLGYPDNSYHPDEAVNRAQMAVYCYRAWIDPDDPAVVNGGPGVTDVNPATATYHGWSSQATDPGFAYVLFDAALLDSAMATAGGGTWDITFDFRDAATPDVTGTTVTVTHNAAALTGLVGTYFTVSTPVPALAAGSYVLVVIVEDKQGDLQELKRTVAFDVS